MKGRGFIVHPYETGDSKYQASYGDNNRTNRSFNTLAEAKQHLKNKGIKTALYDSPGGARDINTTTKIKHNVQHREQKSKLMFGNFGKSVSAYGSSIEKYGILGSISSKKPKSMFRW
jgi:hypothetical protein